LQRRRTWRRARISAGRRHEGGRRRRRQAAGRADHRRRLQPSSSATERRDRRRSGRPRRRRSGPEARRRRRRTAHARRSPHPHRSTGRPRRHRRRTARPGRHRRRTAYAWRWAVSASGPGERRARAIAALPCVLLHRFVDQVIDGALQLARHLLERLPEDVPALKRSCAFLVRIRAHLFPMIAEDCFCWEGSSQPDPRELVPTSDPASARVETHFIGNRAGEAIILRNRRSRAPPAPGSRALPKTALASPRCLISSRPSWPRAAALSSRARRRSARNPRWF
jgi:hypothetical protein